MPRASSAGSMKFVPAHSSPSGILAQVASRTTGRTSEPTSGELGREAAGGDRAPPLDGEADQGLALLLHRLAVLLPVGVLAADAAEVVDQGFDRLGQVDHLGGAVDLDPRPVPVVAVEHQAGPRVAPEVGDLGARRVRRDDDAALLVDTRRHRRELGRAVLAVRHEGDPVSWTHELEELVTTD